MTLMLGETPPEISETCRADALCALIAERTGMSWLAEAGYYVILKPLRILLIVLVALLLRVAIHRVIRRAARRAGEQPSRRLSRGWRPDTPEDTGGLRIERRRQRVQALGSALRAFFTATIVIVAALMILSELGVDLLPLLASAGILGLPLGLGMQHMMKDFFAGLSMLIEDQYGVGDLVHLDDITGTVEEVGLRITTVRDAEGVLWYVRNGEILRAGNRSQGTTTVFVDVPVAFADVARTTEAMRAAAATLSGDPRFASDVVGPPRVLGVEQITTDAAVVRTMVQTTPAAQQRVGRELRRRLAEVLTPAGPQPQTAGDPPLPAQPLGTRTGDEDIDGAT